MNPDEKNSSKPSHGRLPPNPYSLQPVRKRSALAGRSEELRKIEYYLSLLSQGQSHHLALIGNRGVGKTSLLNAAESIARDCHLLPIRVDLDEQKAKAPGPFWMEVYAALLIQIGRLGCWGGVQSEIYASLFTMIHARQIVPLDKVVLQFPYAAATFRGDLENLFCSDSLLLNDLDILHDELSRHSVRGIVLLVDEADCLGANLPLIQMFRNVFQRNQSTCVVLAGTDAVFPTLSDVFPPIPRQFHRISVKPFAHRNQTLELIRKPLESEENRARSVAPNRETIDELHELCAGDPAELQLYCHHMYRLLEQQSAVGKSDGRMSLSPAVFRAILKAYRANAPTNADSVLNAIATLPDDLLYKTRWLRRRRLSIEQNANLRILQRELKSSSILNEDERNEIREDTRVKYEQLYLAGVTVDRDGLTLKAAPLSAGFWKSFVAKEKGDSWSWDDESYESAQGESLDLCLAVETDAKFTRPGTEDGDFADTLAALRRNEAIGDIFPPEVHFFASLVQVIDDGHRTKTIVDATVEFRVNARVFERKFSYGDANEDEVRLRIEKCIEARRDVLLAHKVEIDITQVVAFELPTNDELHRLAYVSGVYLPVEHFGPSPARMALEHHDAGEYEKAADLFLSMLKDREEGQIRNNAAYCLTMVGRFAEALDLYDAATTNQERQAALWIHNVGVLKHLTGDSESGIELLRKALETVLVQEKEDLRAHCMMILNKERDRVSSVNGVPVDAGILINLSILGDVGRESVLERLTQTYPDDVVDWEPLLAGN